MACECELQNTLDAEVTQDTLDVEIGGSTDALLQAKSVDVEYNGTIVVSPDDGFDGLKSVEINTNVPKRFECGNAHFAPPASGATSIVLMRNLQKINVSCWDTSAVTNMNNMFFECLSLQSLDVSSFDTSAVTNMTSMFKSCSSLQKLDVSGFDTSKVIQMSGVFYNCNSLQTLDVSSWDTSKVINMGSMFRNCKKLEKLDISGLNAESVENLYMIFRDTTTLRTLIGNKTLQDVENGLKTMIGLKVSIETRYFNVRFSSILALANGLADLTGGTAQTITISSGSYKNMYNDDDTIPTADVIAERQARIAAICAAKNWNFAH